MHAIALEHVSATLAATGFDYALQQPLFPGKVLLWALFLLSLLSWGVIVSKGISLFRMRRADDEFTKHYRSTRQPMQLFERRVEYPMSLRGMVYEHGAGEAAFQMLGSSERDETFGARMRASQGLGVVQMKAVREALQRGEMAAAAKLREGMPVLSLTSLGAPFVGMLGMAWILMKTFSQGGAGGQLAEVSPGVSGALAMLVVGLIVATPALAGQILMGSLMRERVRKLGDFRSELGRSIEHFYGCDREAPISSVSANMGAHHQPSGRPAPHLDHHAMERAAAAMESADHQPYAAQSPFVLIDGPDDTRVESPIAAYADPEDEERAYAEGLLFHTPFAEERGGEHVGSRGNVRRRVTA